MLAAIRILDEAIEEEMVEDKLSCHVWPMLPSHGVVVGEGAAGSNDGPHLAGIRKTAGGRFSRYKKARRGW